MKRLGAALLSLLMIFLLSPLVAQDKEPAEKPAEKSVEKPAEKPGDRKFEDQIYQEITLEDFETTEYTDKNLQFKVTNEQKASIKIRTEADNAVPAPFNNSKKFLGLKVYARKGDHFTIIPAKELTIDKYCRSIGIWVYGKRFAGELSILVQDVDGTNHMLNMGTLDFLGWRKMEAKIPGKAKQQDEYLNRKTAMKILKIIYSPKNATEVPIWQTLYLDDITAKVREKYSDRQSDEW